MNKKILSSLLATFAARAIPYVEQLAISHYLKYRTDLQDKGKLAIEIAMEEYRRYADTVPFLKLTTLDDDFVRGRLEQVLKLAWEKADEEVKQAARTVKEEVKGAAPSAETGNPVTVTDPYVPSESPPTGVPLEDKHFGKDLHPTPPMDRD